MKKLISITAIAGLLLSSCVKVDNTPSGPLTPTVLPTFTGYFLRMKMDGDSMAFKELQHAKVHDEVINNSISILLIDYSDSLLQEVSSGDKEPVEESTWDETNRIMIEYRDHKGILWTSHILAVDQIVSSKDGHKNSVIESKETFKCILYDGSGKVMELSNVLFRALISTSNSLKGSAIQFVSE